MAEPGRNDPCPCGSGKKYKQCCMKEKQEEEMARYADAWEVDPSDWTLNDVVELQDTAEAVRTGSAGIKEMRALLARLVVNKTEQEIGETPLAELPKKIAELSATINQYLNVPK